MSAAGTRGLVNSHITDRKVSMAYDGDVEVMPVDVVCGRKFPGRGRVGGGVRGDVVELTRAAARRLLLRARNLGGLSVLLTCTYPAAFPTDGRKVKRDLAALRKWLVRRGVAGLWFLEFQRRGAPHYHLFLTGPVAWWDVADAWYCIVGSGDTRHRKAGTRIETLRARHAAGAYAAKYAAKQEQKVVPEEYAGVGRFWGVFGGLQVESVRVRGSLYEVAWVIRMARRAAAARRRQLGREKRRDNGRWSFTAFDIGPVVRRWLDGGL